MNRFIYILFSFPLGIFIAGIISLIVYHIRKKEDQNITYKQCFSKLAFPSIIAAFAIMFLVIIKKQYKSPVQLLLFCAILISGIFTAIKTKNIFIFLFLSLLIIFIILSEIIIKWIYEKITEKKSK